MKVLMFGWEFPPNISGGLGTACYGLTKGLSKLEDVEVTFVVPKVFGGEDKSNINLIGASDVSVVNRKVNLNEFGQSIEFIEVSSKLVPYVDPEEYKLQTTYSVEGTKSLIEVDQQGKVKFTGKYGPDLLAEINHYALVANIIAQDNEFDIIHAHDWLAYPAGINEKIVTFLGRINTQKGPEYFVEAASLILQKMDNVRFVMAGSGDMMNKMIRRAAQLKISHKFHFTGFLKGEDVYKMLQMSDVYIMPSVSEPFGISPLEAMKARVPVVISYQSGVSEILSHVLKVNHWDVEALADAIHGILNYPRLLGVLAQQGKKEASNLKWEDSARGVKKVYRSAMLMNTIGLN